MQSKKINYLDFKKENKLRGMKYVSAFKRVLSSAHYILGEEVENFEKEFAKYTDVKYCVGVANGLEALQVSLMSLGVGKDDEVITTPLSAVATTLAIMAVGAKPVFVDIKENGQIDESLIEKVITKKTKAIIPVHLYGQPFEVDSVKKICKKHNLFLVEDACQAHGTTYKGKKVGGFGEFGAFSFYPTKNLGAIGDAGAIVTNDKKLYEIVREIRDYGQSSKYIHARYGLNSRLDELQAAILREKLKNLEKDNRKRQKIAEIYTKNLSGLKDLEIILPENFEDSNFHLFVIKTKKRDELQNFLKQNGVPSLVHYPVSIPDQPMFNGRYKKTSLPISREFVKEILSLPINPFIKEDEVLQVCKKIKNFTND